MKMKNPLDDLKGYHKKNTIFAYATAKKQEKIMKKSKIYEIEILINKSKYIEFFFTFQYFAFKFKIYFYLFL